MIAHGGKLTVRMPPRYLLRRMRLKTRAVCEVAVFLTFATSAPCFAQADPASEPAVLAVAKVLPAVVNINAEGVVRRPVRDPFDDFYAQFFGYNRFRPREVRQTLQSLGSGLILMPAGTSSQKH